VALFALATSGLSCNESALQAPIEDAGPPISGLSQEQASRVLAKVGDKTITLGDYARTLERIDQFDRLRYQTKERRRELLNEMIDVELLALEAKRRGLDKSPEVDDAVRQILRDAMLARARHDMPAPAEIPADEVRAYYEANIDKFREPERRRVAVIVLEDKKEAEKVLAAAKKLQSAAGWGDLFFKHSANAPKQRPPNAPPDLAGDLGMVGPAEDAKGKNPRVPEPIRAAVFQVGAVGGVADALVESEGRHFIVRLIGLTAGHNRSLAEADRSIRIALIQQKMLERERALEAELRKKFPVEIDDRALAGLKLPQSLEGFDAGTGASAYVPALDERAADGGAEPAADAGP
jgi:peptidyl-prolyl cis-trans isomerase C